MNDPFEDATAGHPPFVGDNASVISGSIIDSTLRADPDDGNTNNADNAGTEGTHGVNNVSNVSNASQGGGQRDEVMSVTIAQMNTFSSIIATAFVQAQAQQAAAAAQPKGPPSVIGVTGVSTSSGLELLSHPRTPSQQLRTGIHSKHNRGDTEEKRLKRKKAVVKALPVKLECSDVLHLMTSDDVTNHDLSKSCKTWQESFRSLKKVFTDNDMLTPFLIPDQFDVDDTSVLKGPYVNLLDGFHTQTDERCQDWQRYLHRHAAPVEIESNNWAVEIMELSLSTELQTLVHDDLEEVELDATGCVTMFKLISNHMVIRNQETIDALQGWIRVFDIRSVDGENISVACGKCRAVIRALGDDLPGNTLKCLLTGFSHATNEEFRQLCRSLLSMNRSRLLQLGNNLSTKQKCFAVFKDLEGAFIDTSTNHNWEGVGHDGSAYRHALASTTQHAMAARRQQPFDEWVKDVECHNCGKKGHLRKDCPEKRTPTHRSRHNRNDRNNDRGRNNRNDRDGDRDHTNQREPRSQRTRERERKFKKLYKAAVDQYVNESSSDESDGGTSPRSSATAGDDDSVSDTSGSDGELAAHAARVLSSLKE